MSLNNNEYDEMINMLQEVQDLFQIYINKKWFNLFSKRTIKKRYQSLFINVLRKYYEFDPEEKDNKKILLGILDSILTLNFYLNKMKLFDISVIIDNVFTSLDSKNYYT